MKLLGLCLRKTCYVIFFLKHNFNVPKFRTYRSISELKEEIDIFTFPILIKPVDSSGSKGVTKLDDVDALDEIFNRAMSFFQM